MGNKEKEEQPNMENKEKMNLKHAEESPYGIFMRK